MAWGKATMILLIKRSQHELLPIKDTTKSKAGPKILKAVFQGRVPAPLTLFL
uniref:Uncharacterized protein n=1 Tax=Rhizophora mucronata TaxID=61149 RepID=A0A2P2JZ77_RHIMU